MRKLIKNQVTDRVVRLGDYIPLRMARAPITSVNYNYVNAHRVPASGEITTSGLQLRFNNVDSDGVNHGAYLAQVAIGDIVTINGQSASITTDPIYTSSGYWYFDVNAWPFMADGNYEVSITQEPPAFSPADLFASGEQGAWYDPSDRSTMFQDIAGTTPVTADGQTVGKILDKSGRGNHAVAPTDAARPLYKTDGTYSWLQFDGVNDSLSTAAINFTSADKMSVFIGARVSGTTNQMPVACGSSGNGRCNILYAAGASPVARLQMIAGDGAAGDVTTPTAGASPIKITNTGLLDMSGGTANTELKLRQNGALGVQNIGTWSDGTGSFGNIPIIIGAESTSPIFPMNGSIHSLIVLGRTSTTQEITDTETWVNSKTGAY